MNVNLEEVLLVSWVVADGETVGEIETGGTRVAEDGMLGEAEVPMEDGVLLITRVVADGEIGKVETGGMRLADGMLGDIVIGDVLMEDGTLVVVALGDGVKPVGSDTGYIGPLGELVALGDGKKVDVRLEEVEAAPEGVIGVEL